MYEGIAVHIKLIAMEERKGFLALRRCKHWLWKWDELWQNCNISKKHLLMVFQSLYFFSF